MKYLAMPSHTHSAVDARIILATRRIYRRKCLVVLGGHR